MKLTLLLCLLAAGHFSHAQSASAITIVDSGRNCSIRGMSIPDNNVIWVSGSNGHVGRSTDGGATWRWTVVAGHEKRDFRDIHAFDSSTAVIMGIDNPAYILKTRDGGRTWRTVFTKEAKGMFLDAMDFRNEKEGICIGDPMENEKGRKTFFIIRTKDSGDTWQREPSDKLPVAAEGEAVFSASGSNIALLRGSRLDYAFISGGMKSGLYLIGRQGKANKSYPIPIHNGKESAGAFSMATDRKKRFYCIGGDYKEPEVIRDNFVWTKDRGKSWKVPADTPPAGYRSCIAIIDDKRMVACGSNGVDLCSSPDRWTRISGEGFNVCAVSPDGKRVYFSGKGRTGVLML